MMADVDWVDAQLKCGIKPQSLRLSKRVKDDTDKRMKNPPADRSLEFNAKDDDCFAVYVADTRRESPEQIACVGFRRLAQEIQIGAIDGLRGPAPNHSAAGPGRGRVPVLASTDSEVGPRSPIESLPRDPGPADSRKPAQRKITSTDAGSGPGTAGYSGLSVFVRSTFAIAYWVTSAAAEPPAH